MKIPKKLLLSGSAIVAFTTLAIAGTPNNKKGVPPIVQDRVLSVSSDSISISHNAIDHKASPANGKNPIYKEIVRVYRIAPWTEVQVDGKRASLSEIKVGMAATISGGAAVSSDGDARVASTIIARTAKALIRPGA